MAEIRVGEKVVNTSKETGVIVSFDGVIITVDFGGQTKKFVSNAFEKGFLRYASAELQGELDAEKIAQQQKEEANRLAKEKAAGERRRIQEELSKAHRRITVLSATLRLDNAPLTMTSVRKKDQELVKQIFALCDEETRALYESQRPELEYLHQTAYGRSKYCTGFLCKYLDTYVFRLFSRNDFYKKDAQKFITVTNSDATEVLRVMRVNGKTYYFSKNLASAAGYLVNTKGNRNWHVSDLNNAIMANEIVRNCDCAYLNDHVEEKNIDCLQYLKLLMSALYNNKAEIVLKQHLFADIYRIEDLEAYLESYTPRQITFAAEHKVLNTLPIIKHYGNLELIILQHLEKLMKKRRNGRSIYTDLARHLTSLGFETEDLDKKLIGFLKKIPLFDAIMYADYINMLRYEPGVTLQDFFDKDYIVRHWAMVNEREVRYSAKEEVDYKKIAEELSWINREENDYYIILPKTIQDFRYEGSHQHNCVYTNGYFRDVIKRQSIIVFLRKEKTVPFVTIEYDYETFEVWQAYTKFNQPIDPKLYQYIVDLGKQLNYEMRSHQ